MYMKTSAAFTADCIFGYSERVIGFQTLLIGKKYN